MSSDPDRVGPILIPMGFWIPRKYSTCAPPSCRVRSPIHRKCAEVLKYFGVVPVGSGRSRVRDCSYSRRRPSCEV